MAEFKVNFPGMQAGVESQKQLERMLRQIQQEVSSINHGLDFKLASKAQIQSSLNKANSQMEQLHSKLGSMRTGLETSLNTYKTTESAVCVGPTLQKISDMFKDLVKPAPDLIFPDWVLPGWILPGSIASVIGGIIGGTTSGGTTIGGIIESIVGSSPSWSETIASFEKKLGGSFNFDESFGSIGGLLGQSIKGACNAVMDALHIGEFEKSGRADWSGTLFDAKGEYHDGLVNADGELKLGDASAYAEYKAGVGEYGPYLGAALGGSVSLLSASGNASMGDADNNIYASGKLDVGKVDADASASLGYIGQDANGNPVYGAKGNAEIGAYAAKGTVDTGFTIFGIKVNLAASGTIGAGASAHGEISTKGCSFGASAGLLFGGGVDVSIDWSGFKFPKLKFW